MRLYSMFSVLVGLGVMTTVCGCADGRRAASHANAAISAAEALPPPAIGDTAADFTLKKLKDDEVNLAKLLVEGPVVLVVLRGYPGYQCPLCTRQVGELLSRADAFAAANASVVLVYPGERDKLAQFAKEFVSDQHLPEEFHFVLDPDYEFTDAYHVRWDAPSETAYPSSFVIDRNGTVQYAKVSTTHGDRAPTDDLLMALKMTK
jgi:peroxiredoxin Q/BCP